jgi:ABC-type oligopeptide transport system ATPase subunit
MKTILKTEHLNKVYHLGSFTRKIAINALNDVNLSVQSDEPVIISLVGESGSGKTTLAKTILRLVKPTSGSAVVADQLVAGVGAKPGRTEFLSTVQPIFQNPFEAFSRYRTIDAYLYETATRVAQLGKQAAIDAMEEALTSVGLEYRDVRGKYPNQFSGGELQRASIARALIPHDGRRDGRSLPALCGCATRGLSQRLVVDGQRVRLHG